MPLLHDEVALITGSTKGIGRAIARKFAAEGAKVIVTGRSADSGKKVVDDITATGGEAVYHRADLTDEGSVRELVVAAAESFGKLTVLVNNAVSTELLFGPEAVDTTVRDLTTEGWNSVMASALNSVFWTSKYAIPELEKAGGGSIVNISSLAAVRGVYGAAAYSAAKGAVCALSRAIAAEEAEHGIRCNSVVVGIIPMAGRDDGSVDWGTVALEHIGDFLRSLQLTRLGEPEDIANVCAFLASRQAEYFTGLELMADGGATCKLQTPRDAMAKLASQAQ